MKIDKILAGIKSSQEPAAKPAEKVAAEAAPVTATPRDALSAALAAATSTEKVAAEKAPAVDQPVVADVMKIANEIAESEKQAAVAEAKLLGDAFGDALLGKLGNWTKTAEALLEKLNAGAPAVAGGDTKVASEDQLRVAAEQGYNYAIQQVEKLAADEYDRGWNETVDAIYQTAGNEFLKAASVTAQLIEAGSK